MTAFTRMSKSSGSLSNSVVPESATAVSTIVPSAGGPAKAGLAAPAGRAMARAVSAASVAMMVFLMMGVLLDRVCSPISYPEPHPDPDDDLSCEVAPGVAFLAARGLDRRVVGSRSSVLVEQTDLHRGRDQLIYDASEHSGLRPENRELMTDDQAVADRPDPSRSVAKFRRRCGR